MFTSCVIKPEESKDTGTNSIREKNLTGEGVNFQF